MQLPIEIWCQIFNFLSLKEQLFYLRPVCIEWRNFVLDKRNLDLTELLNGRIIKELLLLFNRETVKTLTISKLDIKAELLKKIFRRYINLETLNLINVCSYWSVFTNIEHNKKLKVLNLASARYLGNYQLFLIALNCKHIEHLNLSDQFMVTDISLNMIFNNFKNLKLLNIKDCPNYSKDYLEQLMVKDKDIKVLF